MGTTDLKNIRVYVTETELERVKDKAEAAELTVSAFTRRRLGLPVRPPGAPPGNVNALGHRRKKPAAKP